MMSKAYRVIIAIFLTATLLTGCGGELKTDPAATKKVETPAATWRIATAQPTATETPATATAVPPPTPSPSPSAKTGSKNEIVMYVTLEQYGSTLTVRAGPSAKAEAAGSLNHRDAVTVLGITGGWAKILHNGQERYVKADYLALAKPPAQKKTKATPGKAANPTPSGIRSPLIKIYKSRRVLELWDGKKQAGTYPMALGWEPKGHKKQEGDGRTPEGEYYVCTRNAASSYYKSLGVSYPGKQDADKGYEAGLITASERDTIKQAISDRACPPWNTALGGAIMIHGGGSGNDWTAGCIAVENEVMDILWECCKNGTKILIYP